LTDSDDITLHYVVEILPATLRSPLVDIIRTLNITHGSYIETGRAVKLLLQPLGQALARGLADLQLSIELQDMLASLEPADDAAVQVGEADGAITESSETEHDDTEKMFDSWVSSIIKVCKQYVLKQ
jgi:hypothetical protein